MGFTGALIVAGVSAGAGLIAGNQQKQAIKGQQGALNRSLAQSIAKTPPPPSATDLNNQSAAAMTAAAARARRQAASAGGFSSTVLTSGLGAAPAVTQRKQLIGQ